MSSQTKSSNLYSYFYLHIVGEQLFRIWHTAPTFQFHSYVLQSIYHMTMIATSLTKAVATDKNRA